MDFSSGSPIKQNGKFHQLVYPGGNFYEVEEPKVLPFLMHASGSEIFIADLASGVVVLQAIEALSPHPLPYPSRKTGCGTQNMACWRHLCGKNRTVSFKQPA